MPDEDFAALVADIETYGVREPAWTWNKQVIDGRHRLRACEELGIKCPTREYEGTEAELVAFVLSLNLKRRHLDTSQRAMVAAALAKLPHGGDRRSDQAANLPLETQSAAASLLNVGERSVRAAKTVIEEGVPELKEAVERGEVSVAAAEKVAKLPKAEQRKAVKQGKVAEKAAEQREKKPKPDASERLKAELEEANDTIKELAAQQQPLQDEVEFLRKIETEGDKLAAACAEVKRLQAVVRGQEERIRGLMTEKNEAVRAAKMWKAKFEKAQRAAA
jgi:ParB-like chromosome segregation protein Spo0J